MRYYEIHNNGYVVGVGKGDVGTEITEERYNSVLSVLPLKPPAIGNTDYLLTIGLVWEPYERPPAPPPEPTVEDKAEAYDILMGVSE